MNQQQQHQLNTSHKKSHSHTQVSQVDNDYLQYVGKEPINKNTNNLSSQIPDRLSQNGNVRPLNQAKDPNQNSQGFGPQQFQQQQIQQQPQRQTFNPAQFPQNQPQPFQSNKFQTFNPRQYGNNTNTFQANPGNTNQSQTFQQNNPYQKPNGFQPNNTYNKFNSQNNQKDQQIDQLFHQQIIKSILERNSELSASHIDITKGLMECFKIVGSIFAPVLEEKAMENLKLKRLISQRLGIENDDQAIEQAVGFNLNEGSKRPKISQNQNILPIQNRMSQGFSQQRSQIMQSESQNFKQIPNFPQKRTHTQLLQNYPKKFSQDFNGGNNMLQQMSQDKFGKDPSNYNLRQNDGSKSPNRVRPNYPNQAQQYKNALNSSFVEDFPQNSNQQKIDQQMYHQSNNSEVQFFKGNQRMQINQDQLKKGQQLLSGQFNDIQQQENDADDGMDFDPDAILKKSIQNFDNNKLLSQQNHEDDLYKKKSKH
eukprot:403356689